MGQAKLKQRAAFSPQIVADWEAELCVNFAVALSRLTGWILHVDWWSPSADRKEEVPIDLMRPLRAYVADNHDRVFDVRGLRLIEEFTLRTIHPLAMPYGSGSVRTRYYAEQTLVTLPLPAYPDEIKVANAIVAINANSAYLTSIPKRPIGGLPAHQAATFTFGRCGPFAEALREQTGLPVVALMADRYTPLFGLGEPGYVHSVLLHPDGSVEDAWGLSSVKHVAERFGLAEFHLDAQEHERVIANLKRNTPERYEKVLAEAKTALTARHVA